MTTFSQIVLYLRVSDPTQREGLGLERQHGAMLKLLESDYPDAPEPIIITDAGLSRDCRMTLPMLRSRMSSL